MSSDQGYTIHRVDSTAGFDALADDWRRLERQVGHINLTVSYDWLRTWWAAFEHKNNNQFGFDKQLRILLFHRAGTLVAIVPLVRVVRRRLLTKTTYIEFLGQQWTAQMNDVIAAEPDPEIVPLTQRWLSENDSYDVLQLTYIPGGSPFFDAQDARLTLLSACPIFYHRDYADYETYKKTVYTKNFRNAVRKNYNRIEGRELKFEVIRPRAADAPSLAEMARLSMDKLGDGKHSHWLDADKARFFAAAAQAVPSEALFLKINDENLVYLYNFFFGSGLHAYDTSYNRGYRDLSLGRLVFVESIKHTFTQPEMKFHCAGTGLGFHKRGHYPDVIPIHTFTAPGNSKKAEARAADLLARNRLTAENFAAELRSWREHE